MNTKCPLRRHRIGTLLRRRAQVKCHLPSAWQTMPSRLALGWRSWASSAFLFLSVWANVDGFFWPLDYVAEASCVCLSIPTALAKRAGWTTSRAAWASPPNGRRERSLLAFGNASLGDGGRSRAG